MFSCSRSVIWVYGTKAQPAKLSSERFLCDAEHISGTYFGLCSSSKHRRMAGKPEVFNMHVEYLHFRYPVLYIP